MPFVRSFHRAVYNAMDVILTVSERDAENFRSLKLSRPDIAAVVDTRYDRVSGKAAESRKRNPIPDAPRAPRFDQLRVLLMPPNIPPIPMPAKGGRGLRHGAA